MAYLLEKPWRCWLSLTYHGNCQKGLLSQKLLASDPGKDIVGIIKLWIQDEVILISTIKIPPNYQSNTIQIKALIKWLACKNMHPGEQKGIRKVKLENQQVEPY